MSLLNLDVGDIGKMKSSNINEGNEFASNSYATRSVDNGTPDVTVSVPGGTKESPSSKPHDQHSVSVPGGDGEKPHVKAVSGASVSIPGKITLTDSEYNAAIDQLQKSFESVGISDARDVLDQLRNVNIVPDPSAIIESAIDDAFLEALENGPLFEAVDRSDKKEVKKIVADIRRDIKEACDSEGVSFYKPALVARLLTSAIPGVNAMAGAPSSWQQVFSTRLWQVLGICHIESGNVTTLQKSLTEKFKDRLGDYKILLVKTTPGLHDVFKVKFNWKNNKGAYFMLVDKKLDSEIKGIINNMKPEEENKDVKTESIKEGTEMNDMYTNYLLSFAESGAEGRPLSLTEFSEAVAVYEENGDLDEFLEKNDGWSAFKKQAKAEGLSKEEIGTHKQYKTDTNKDVEEFISYLYDSYCKDCETIIVKQRTKKNGTVKTKTLRPIKEYKFRGIMKAIMKGEAKKNRFPHVDGEIVIDLPESNRPKVEKVYNNIISGTVDVSRALADKTMNYFQIGENPGTALAKVESADVIDHLDDFLSENIY